MAAAALLVLGAAAVALAWVVPLPARLVAPSSVVVEFRDGTPAYVFTSADEKWRIPLRREEVDPAYLRALVRLEDKRFWRHPGVDPLALARAAWLNVTRGKVVSGGSTLTMQLVRVLEPRPRTLRSKAVEALRAVQLELRWSKAEILEAYLQFVPFGRNVEGVEAASLAYFGHSARTLSAAEIATLLAVPQDPARRYPTASNAARLARARDDLAARLVAEGQLPGLGALTAAELLEQVRRTQAPSALRPFPRSAPHAAIWMRSRAPGTGRLRTTLDAGAQRIAEEQAQAVLSRVRTRGIHNGAIVLVDHASGEVRALVGNLSFWDRAHGGQVAGFDRPRSTGSALKPFLFARAIDLGLALPETMVADVPTSFGGYAPKNFDDRFSGMVRLDEALASSLNIPFVRLLGDIGVERFAGELRSLGMDLNPNPGHYGVSAAVGGMELTPLELAGLYAALAKGGEHRPLRWRPERVPAPARRAFSSGAAWLTRRALSSRNRPDLPAWAHATGAAVPIHWKTGTSFGHRDAWAAGSGPTFTAVVWMGNFDNAPTASLVGASAAAPLLFDLLEAVEPRQPRAPSDFPPQELREVEVCALSGHLPAEACPSRKRVLGRVASLPAGRCPYHLRIEVDVHSGHEVNPTCRAGTEYQARTVVEWPSAARRWLRQEYALVAERPRLSPRCRSAGTQPPRLVHPPAGQQLVLLAGVGVERQQVPLEAEAGPGARSLDWFVDGVFLGTHGPDERVWWTPSRGEHEVVVVDEAGLSTRRVLAVR